MMRRLVALSVLVFAPAIFPQTTQPAGLIPASELPGLLRRSVQLIESTSASAPGLVRAAAPVHENTRQALLNIESGPARHPGLLYDFIVDLRSYLALADSVPKPAPFPDEARKQFAELRDSLDRLQSHFRVTLDQLMAQTRSPDRDNLRRYAEANAKLAKPAPGRRVVFFGDSITDFWRLNEYFPDHDFVNRGISGQVTSEMLARMKADVIDLQPAAVLILAGTNDIARGTPLSTIEGNLLLIADLADVYKIKPMFASVLPVSDYHKDVDPRNEMTRTRAPATILELNRWIDSFCKQRHYVYVDYFPQLVDSSGQLKADLADDGLHPNAAGYRIMAPVAMEAIDRNILKPALPVSSKRGSKARAESKPRETPVAAVPTAAPAAAAPPTVAPTAPPSVAPSAAPAAAPALTTKAVEDAPKKKKEPFWKRTYPSAQPQQK